MSGGENYQGGGRGGLGNRFGMSMWERERGLEIERGGGGDCGDLGGTEKVG